MKKLLPLLLTLILVFTACTTPEPQQLPYGATMSINKIAVTKDESGNDIKIPMLYDNRYFTDEEVLVLAKYFYAIQYNNLEVFEEIMLPYFQDYFNAAMGTTTITSGDWLQEFYTLAVQTAGKTDFKFFEIEVIEYDPQTLLDELYKVIEFEKSYNELNNITEQIVTRENTHAMVIEGKIGEKYIEAKLFMSKTADGKYYLMTIS